MSGIKNPIQPLQRPPSLHHTVQEAIKAYIIDNRLRAGDPLPSEHELGRQLAVSRNLIREAIRGLESLGVVEIRRGSGRDVGEFSFEPLLDNLQYGLMFELQELKELLTIRRVLETGMIAEAIERKTPEQVAHLQAILEQMRLRAEQGESFPEEDRRFHQCLFENLDNRTLLRILDAFWLTLHKALPHTDIQDRDPRFTYQLHVPIVEAFARGAVEETRIALDKHHIGIETRLRKVTGDPPSVE